MLRALSRLFSIPHKLALFRAVKKGRFAFIGNGESVFHPVFIDDLISGILLAIERRELGQETGRLWMAFRGRDDNGEPHR